MKGKRLTDEQITYVLRCSEGRRRARARRRQPGVG